MANTVKITALTDIGANMSYTVLLPVVNMAGTPLTEKANVQNLGNYILSQAGGANLVAASVANISYTVANASQPNITSVGTLTSLTVSGNTTTNNITANKVSSSVAMQLAVYANDGARDSAIPSPQRGMMVFNQNGNVFQGFDGVIWVNLN